MDGQRVKVTIVFTVNPEYVPGLFYDAEDFARSTCDDIMRRLVSYNPTIEETITRILDNAEKT